MSNIEWTDKTWNPVIGCTPVSPGCLNCYAATMARRLEGMGVEGYQPRLVDDRGREHRGAVPEQVVARSRTVRIAEVRGGRAVFTGEVRTLPDRLAEPLKWRKPARVFVNSMSDLFHPSVPFEFVDQVFAVMALCPQHTFQVLTKRPERMAEYLARPWAEDGDRALAALGAIDADLRDREMLDLREPLPNVWLGTSVENQDAADERIPHLLRCPAAVRFLSCEPLLGAVDLRDHLMGVDANHGNCVVCGNTIGCTCDGDGAMIDWVIVGGESGPKARPCDVAWSRGVVKQCRDAGVPVFVKQLGSAPFYVDEAAKRCGGAVAVPVHSIAFGGWEHTGKICRDRKGADPAEWPEDLRVREWPKGHDAGGGA